MSESAFETRMLKCIRITGNNESNEMKWVNQDGQLYDIRVGELQNTDLKPLLYKWFFVQSKFFQGKRKVVKIVPVVHKVFMNRLSRGHTDKLT